MSETIGGALDRISAVLAKAGFDEARRRARRLVAAALDLPPTEIVAHPDHPIAARARERIAEILCRTIAREPLSRILGAREFWGLEFLLSADALDPRPETETVVEAVLAHLPQRDRPYRFLDLGTGSGCLLLALLSEYRRACGIGIDLAPGAARVARDNAVRLGLAARASFAVGDWSAAVSGVFDAIVANPPYIASATIPRLPAEVREYDPALALDGGPDGLVAYRAIAIDLPRLLAPGGVFAAEIGAGQRDAVATTLGEAGLAIAGVTPDLAGIPRCILARR